MSSAFSDEPAPRGRGPNGLIVMAVMGVGMLAGILFLAWLGTPRIEPTEGQPLKRMELVPIAYADKELSESDLQGKVTVLHFWGTWCPHCMTEFPEFTKMADELKGQDGIQVLSVASSAGPEYDMDELTEETKKYLEQQQVQMPTYADPAALTRGQVAVMLPDNALVYPCTLVLDSSGIVQATWIGYRAGNMEQARQKALALRAEAAASGK